MYDLLEVDTRLGVNGITLLIIINKFFASDWNLNLSNASTDPAKNHLHKVNNRNTRKSYEIYSKLTVKTPERRHRSRFGVFSVNLEHISDLFLLFLQLTLSISFVCMSFSMSFLWALILTSRKYHEWPSVIIDRLFHSIYLKTSRRQKINLRLTRWRRAKLNENSTRYN